MVAFEARLLRRFAFSRQVPFGHYFADFACHHIRLAIEIDGETHLSAGTPASDELRLNYFQSHGYRALRFWNSDAMNNLEGVMILIQQAVAEQMLRQPPPLTPPRASRERGML